MVRHLLSLAVLCALVGTAQAATTHEETNSGTSSYLAQELRACDHTANAEACKTQARQGSRYYRDEARLPVNWAQDHWR